MNKESKLITVVVSIGYLVYAVLFIAASAHGLIGLPTGNVTVENTEDTRANNTDLSATDIKFQEVSAQKGINYSGTVHYNGTNAMISNAGSYAVDYDNDGDQDLFLIGGDQPAMYENVGGEFRQTDSMPAIDRSVRAALFFDYDNDGWQDLLLLSMNDTALFLENQNGTFVKSDIGLDKHFESPIGATTADYTGNGCPDLFVIQYGDWTENHPAGEREYNVSAGSDNGYENYLYRGNCSSFESVNEEAGIEGTRWSLATSFVDLTGNGRPDIHVTNDFNYDIIYLNQGNKSFNRVELSERTNRNGMSSEVTDITGNGLPDLFVTNVYFPDRVNETMDTTMQFRANGNNLLINQGNGSFEDRAKEYGVRQGGWGWAAVIADFDSDGRQDIFHTTRRMTFKFSDKRFSERDRRLIRLRYPFFRYPVLYERGDDGTFQLRSPDDAGLLKSDSRGVSGLDFDRDGDIDLLVANANGEYQLYENMANSQSAVQVAVEGDQQSTVLGTQVTVITPNHTRQKLVTANTDFLSQDSRVLHFGLPESEQITISIEWPDGTKRTLSGVNPGQRIVVSRDGSTVNESFG